MGWRLQTHLILQRSKGTSLPWIHFPERGGSGGLYSNVPLSILIETLMSREHFFSDPTLRNLHACEVCVCVCSCMCMRVLASSSPYTGLVHNSHPRFSCKTIHFHSNCPGLGIRQIVILLMYDLFLCLLSSQRLSKGDIGHARLRQHLPPFVFVPVKHQGDRGRPTSSGPLCRVQRNEEML